MLKCSPDWGNLCTDPLQSKHQNRAKFLYDWSICDVSTATLMPPRCRALSTRWPSAPLVPTRLQRRRPVQFDVTNQLPLPQCTCVEFKRLSWCSVLCKHLNSPAIGIRDDNDGDIGGLLTPALYRYLASAE